MTLQEALKPFTNREGRACRSKERYASREAAAGVGRRDGYRLYVYQCPVCSGFHLTKKMPDNKRVSKYELASVGR